MESREIVRRAVHFEGPPRLPVNMPRLGASDIGELWPVFSAGFKPAVPGEDEWGCVWETTAVKNMGQVKGHPLANGPNPKALRVPDYTDMTHYAHYDAELAGHEAAGRYVVAGIFMTIFERMHSLMGFESVLAGLLEEPAAMGEVADRIVEAHVTMVDSLAARYGGRLNGFHMTDDWGTQQAAFVSLDLWKEFFLPRYRRLYDRMHHHGYDVWLHSCGKVNELVEGFILAGVNVVNLQQPRALGIEEMGRRYRGRIAFESLADIQVSLVRGGPSEVAKDAVALGTHWMAKEGGFIFSDYGEDDELGLKDDGLKRYMYDCFSRESERVYGAPLPPLTNQRRGA